MAKIVKMGSLAQYILDRRIPLEMCLSSNVHTGAVRSMAEHPFKLYYDRGFRVTLNTDDRLMSDTTHDQGISASPWRNLVLGLPISSGSR